MILFFYGEDTFRLHRKAKELKEQFYKKDPSGMNFMGFDSDNFDIAAFSEAVRAQPFMVKARLVVVRDIFSLPASVRDEVSDFLKNQKNINNVVVFVADGAPDKRTTLFRFLQKEARVQEFSLMHGHALQKWTEEHLKEFDFTFEVGVLEYFLALSGNNLWRVHSFLQIFRGYCKEGVIRKDDVDQFVVGEYSSGIFDALDALAKREKAKALQLLHEQLLQNKHPLYVMTMLVSHFRQLLILADLEHRRIPSSESARQSKLHPFVVKKLQPALRRFPYVFLRKAYIKLTALDEAVKTGDISAITAIDMFVVSVG